MAKMTPSPASKRRSYISSSSPNRPFSVDFLSDDRNSQLSHHEALEAARTAHDRVREAAIRVFEMNALEEERKKIELLQRKEQERIRREEEMVAEQMRLRALQAKMVPKPPPLQEPAPQPSANPPKPASPRQSQKAPAASTPQTTQKENVASKPASVPSPSPFAPAQDGSVFSKSPFNSSPQASLKTMPQTNGFGSAVAKSTIPSQLGQKTQSPQSVSPVPAPTTNPPKVDPYLRIHQALKGLRRDLVSYSTQPNSPLKGKLGDMRREVRKSMGQLTGQKGANAIPVNKVKTMLKDSLSGAAQSPLVDAATFVADRREPMAGAKYNDERLPALFIYLINIMGKFMINQFASECGASPKAADPIGVVAAQIFSDPDFHWRGRPMIDILLAKFRKECPVVFGMRGSDSTSAGRLAIGWRREGGNQWMPEQMHNDRMAGLGAGFAAVALRDFSKAKKENPYPPSHYWTAVARIVNTPAGQVSDTQYIVLRAMIDGHENRFLQFYGNAALAALKAALVDFPQKAPKSSSAATLKVLGEVMQSEKGLYLG